jgi:hypothetical protein
MLCFWQLEITTKRNLSRALAEMNATGVVYTPGVCRGQTALTHTFWGALYTDQRGYSLCSFTGWAVVSLELRNGQMRVPRFLYAVHKMLEPLTLGYQSDLLLLADAWKCGRHTGKRFFA